MANTTQIEQRKVELVKQLEESRGSILGTKMLLDEQIASKKEAIKASLNLPKKVKKSFTAEPLKSSLIALGTGLTASILFRKRGATKRNQQKEKSTKKSISAAVTLALLKPVLQRLAMHYFHQWLDRREQQQAQQLSYPHRKELL